jgi:transcriptional regulator PpsR
MDHPPEAPREIGAGVKVSHDGMNMLNAGMVPLLGSDLLSSISSTLSDIVLVVDLSCRIHAAASDPNHRSFGELPRWAGTEMSRVLDGDSAIKLQDRLATLGAMARRGERLAQMWCEVTHRLEDGIEVPVRYSMHWLGQGDRVLMLGRDQRPMIEVQQQLVSAQIALERDYETQREIDTRYRLLMDVTSDAILLVATGTRRVVDVNHNAAALLGASRADLIGTDILSEFEGPRQGELMDTLASTAGSDLSAPVEVQARRSQKRLNLHPKVFRAAGERLVLCRLDEAGGGSNGANAPDPLATNLRQLFYKGVDGIVFTDKDGQILSASESFLNLTDTATLSAMRGRSLGDYLARGSVDLKVLLDNARRAGNLRLYSTKLTTDFNSQIAVDISATWLNDRTQPVMALVVRDASRSEALRSNLSTTDNNMRNVLDLVGSSSLKDIVAETTNVVEKICIETAVELTRNNRVAAAEMLGLSRQSLYVKLRKYGLLNRDED